MSNEKHIWKRDGIVNFPGYLQCKKCGIIANASCDPLDTNGIVEFLNETYARRDCKGRRS